MELTKDQTSRIQTLLDEACEELECPFLAPKLMTKADFLAMCESDFPGMDRAPIEECPEPYIVAATPTVSGIKFLTLAHVDFDEGRDLEKDFGSREAEYLIDVMKSNLARAYAQLNH